MMKCRNCGKRVRQFGGVWYHYWRLPDDKMVTVPAGNRECSWRMEPAEVTTHAEPGEAEEAQTPARYFSSSK